MDYTLMPDLINFWKDYIAKGVRYSIRWREHRYRNNEISVKIGGKGIEAEQTCFLHNLLLFWWNWNWSTGQMSQQPFWTFLCLSLYATGARDLQGMELSSTWWFCLNLQLFWKWTYVYISEITEEPLVMHPSIY